MSTAITNLRIAASGSSNHALRDDAGHPGLLDLATATATGPSSPASDHVVTG